MSEIENSYWAGIIDGEGCISCQRDNRGGGLWFGYIALGNTSEFLLKAYCIYFGIRAKIVERVQEIGKTYFQIRSTGVEAKRIISLIQPYLKIKRVQADLVLLLLSDRDKRVQGHGNHIPRRIRKLNRRGKIRPM